jgi:hypothetical protein
MYPEKIAEIFRLESVMETNEELDWRLIDQEFLKKNLLMSFDLQFLEETQGYFYGHMGFGFGCHPHVVWWVLWFVVVHFGFRFSETPSIGEL